MGVKFYLSTTADFGPSYENPKDMGPCAKLAVEHGLGLEIADFCICSNLDERYPIMEKLIRRKQELVPDLLMHAPFNELCPAAIDPWIREIAKKRFLQIFGETVKFNAKKLVVHTGFDPMIYRKEWFVPQSIGFWKDLLKECPEGLELVLENVMEKEPDMLVEICDGVADERFRICLDIGHANLMPVPVREWLSTIGGRLSHMHVHNNEGSRTKELIAAKDDLHHALGNGILDVDCILKQAAGIREDITITVETTYIEDSVKWLIERSYIR